MKHYDPNISPIPGQWLELTEHQRIELAQLHHEAARVELPSVKAHAAMHAIVENQIAMGLPSAVRALPRLMGEGLSRHDAVHAIASVVAEYFFAQLNGKDAGTAKQAQERYDAALEQLSASVWLAKEAKL